MRFRMKAVDGSEADGRPPRPDLFSSVTEVRRGRQSRWYATVDSLEDLAILVSRERSAASGRGAGMAISGPDADDGDCGFVLTVRTEE